MKMTVELVIWLEFRFAFATHFLIMVASHKISPWRRSNIEAEDSKNTLDFRYILNNTKNEHNISFPEWQKRRNLLPLLNEV